MSLRRAGALTLSAAALTLTTTATAASAHPAPVSALTHVEHGNQHTTSGPTPRTQDISGTVYGPRGYPVDDISVTATPLSGSRTPVASAITYGGTYDLYLPPGRYRLTYTDLAGRFTSRTYDGLVVTRHGSGIELDDVDLAYPAPRLVTAPAVTGTPTPGSVLTATTGTWAPAAVDAEVTWLRDGQEIAHGQTYRVLPRDRGHALTARVTAHADLTDTAQATSAPVRVGKVRPTIEVDAHPHGRNIIVEVDVTEDPTAGDIVVRDAGRVVGRTELRHGRDFAVVVLRNVRPGDHQISVTYSGDEQHLSATSRTTQVHVRN